MRKTGTQAGMENSPNDTNRDMPEVPIMKPPISVPLPQHLGYGDLSRSVVHEVSRDWPDLMQIVAWWGGKSVAITITAEDYFGSAGGTPMGGDRMLFAIERLRKAKAQARKRRK